MAIEQARPKQRTRPLAPAFGAPLAAAAVLTLLAIGLVLSGPVRADHNELYVVCPEPISEGETDHMQVTYPGYRGIGVTVFTYQGSYTADGSDFVSYNRVKMKGDSDSDTLWIPAITVEDSRSEHDETFALGFWVSAMWHGCVVTIDDDDTPRITGVDIASEPAEGDTYRAGESIDLTLTLDRDVDVTGELGMSLYVGDGNDHSQRKAAYAAGSGGRSLTFSYPVAVTDLDTDGLSVSPAALDDDGNPAYGFQGSGKIVAAGTDVPIDYTHDGIRHAEDHRIDGRPHVESVRVTSAPPGGWDAYRANQIIEVEMRFNTEVVVEGTVHAGLYVGLDGENTAAASRPAGYRSGSGTDTLTFGYSVRPGDMDARGIVIAAGGPDTGLGGSGTIKAAGTDVEVNPGYAGTDHLPDHTVDTEPPAVSSIDFESLPGDGVAYGAGESIVVRVRFSEAVTITGAPQLELDVGGTPRRATLRSEATGEAAAPQRAFSSTAVFQYEVADGDTDTDGVGIDANSLRLNGGDIRDSAGNAAGLSHDAVAADPTQQVNTLAQAGAE